MLPIPAAGVIIFVGLGYAILEYFPETAGPIDARSYDIYFIPFLIIYGLFVAYFIFRAVKQYRKRQDVEGA